MMEMSGQSFCIIFKLYDCYTLVFMLMIHLPLSDSFDAIIVSSEVGFEKPSPEIFRTALGTKMNCFQLIRHQTSSLMNYS